MWARPSRLVQSTRTPSAATLGDPSPFGRALTDSPFGRGLMSGLVLRTSMTPGCEARSLWLRPILDDSHFTTACDTSNMASVFRLIYAHEVRTGAKFAPSFAIRGKTCGPMGRRPTFCWGPSTRRAARIRAVGRIFQIRLWELAARAQTCGSSQREHKPVGARGASTKIFESSKFLYPKYQLAS